MVVVGDNKLTDNRVPVLKSHILEAAVERQSVFCGDLIDLIGHFLCVHRVMIILFVKFSVGAFLNGLSEDRAVRVIAVCECFPLGCCLILLAVGKA